MWCVVSVYTYMRVLALLVLVAVADALAFRPARRARDDKSILRLAQDEPIPEGWRLATASDAECNRVCFGLVLRPRDWRRKRDEVDLASNLKVSAPDSRNAFASASVRVEQRTPQEEKCAYKVAVRFKESRVLKREHIERVLSRVQRICGYYILAFSITSISPLLCRFVTCLLSTDDRSLLLGVSLSLSLSLSLPPSQARWER